MFDLLRWWPKERLTMALIAHIYQTNITVSHMNILKNAHQTLKYNLNPLRQYSTKQADS